jgi:hypothetical protein
MMQAQAKIPLIDKGKKLWSRDAYISILKGRKEKLSKEINSLTTKKKRVPDELLKQFEITAQRFETERKQAEFEMRQTRKQGTFSLPITVRLSLQDYETIKDEALKQNRQVSNLVSFLLQCWAIQRRNDDKAERPPTIVDSTRLRAGNTPNM